MTYGYDLLRRFHANMFLLFHCERMLWGELSRNRVKNSFVVLSYPLT